MCRRAASDLNYYGELPTPWATPHRNIDDLYITKIDGSLPHPKVFDGSLLKPHELDEDLGLEQIALGLEQRPAVFDRAVTLLSLRLGLPTPSQMYKGTIADHDLVITKVMISS